jgi:hypothetical protein
MTQQQQLYGSFMGIDNPGEDQHIDLSGLGPQQGPCAGVGRGARRQDIVDQDDAAALNLG